MATGWREMDGAWYYFDGSGHMATGITEVNGLHYYLDPATGRMAANTVLELNGTSYQADASGVLSQMVSENQDGTQTAGQSQEGGQTASAEAPGTSQSTGTSGGPRVSGGPGVSAGAPDVVITPVG